MAFYGWLGATNCIACGVVVSRNRNASCPHAIREGCRTKIATNRTTAADTVSRGEKIKPTNFRPFGVVVRRDFVLPSAQPTLFAPHRKIATNRGAGRDTVSRD